MRSGARIPAEALIALHARLATLPPRHASRAKGVQRLAAFYGVSPSTVYRQLRGLYRPKGLRRADRGVPRALPRQEAERYCEIVAALKIRTGNGKGRKFSTGRAIEVLEEHGVDTPDGHVQPNKGLLVPTTVNRWLRTFGYEHGRLTRAPPAGSDGHRTTARSKGKVERPFRTVKEAHETLYHFHVPETEAEANAWLVNYIDRYNERPHRREPRSRLEDWLERSPEHGVRQMCSWELPSSSPTRRGRARRTRCHPTEGAGRAVVAQSLFDE